MRRSANTTYDMLQSGYGILYKQARNANTEYHHTRETPLPPSNRSYAGQQKERPEIPPNRQEISLTGAETAPARQPKTAQKLNAPVPGGSRENTPEEETPQKKNRFKRRRRGRIPLKRRKSILKRLREYQKRLSLLRNAAANTLNG